MFKLYPSILSADQARLGAQVQEAADAGADGFHIDIMDGHFVPNLSYGPGVVKALRPVTKRTLDVHLMTDTPWMYFDALHKGGADAVTVHYEACPDPVQVLAQLREMGMQAGMSLKPATHAGLLRPWLSMLDLILVMGVEPGWGGQSYIPAMTDKIAALRHMVEQSGRPIRIAVDGGMNAGTIPLVLAAGADTIIAGSQVFHGDIARNTAALRAVMQTPAAAPAQPDAETPPEQDPE